MTANIDLNIPGVNRTHLFNCEVSQPFLYGNVQSQGECGIGHDVISSHVKDTWFGIYIIPVGLSSIVYRHAKVPTPFVMYQCTYVCFKTTSSVFKALFLL